MKYLKALKENNLERFTIKAIGWALPEISGLLKEGFGRVSFKVLNGLEQLLHLDFNRQLFAIDFHTNRTTFQIQHNALKWFQSHKLFGKLIQNKKYSINEGLFHENLYEIR